MGIKMSPCLFHEMFPLCCRVETRQNLTSKLIRHVHPLREKFFHCSRWDFDGWIEGWNHGWWKSQFFIIDNTNHIAIIYMHDSISIYNIFIYVKLYFCYVIDHWADLWADCKWPVGTLKTSSQALQGNHSVATIFSAYLVQNNLNIIFIYIYIFFLWNIPCCWSATLCGELALRFPKTNISS